MLQQKWGADIFHVNVFFLNKCPVELQDYMVVIFFKIDFREKKGVGGGREEKAKEGSRGGKQKRNMDQLPSECALTRIQTHYLLVHRMMFQPIDQPTNRFTLARAHLLLVIKCLGYFP